MYHVAKIPSPGWRTDYRYGEELLHEEKIVLRVGELPWAVSSYQQSAGSTVQCWFAEDTVVEDYTVRYRRSLHDVVGNELR